MTRARENLILVGSPRKLDKALERWTRPATPYAAGTAIVLLATALAAVLFVGREDRRPHPRAQLVGDRAVIDAGV